MTTYTKTTDFAAKDALVTGNPLKKVKGSEIGTEFDNIAAADADNVKTSGLGTGVATFLATPSSASLRGALTDETGTGSAVFATSPTLVTPTLGAATATSVNGCKINLTGTRNLFIAASTPSLGGSNSDNIGIGENTLSSITTNGINNIAIGWGSMQYMTDAGFNGRNNTAVGYNSMADAVVTGVENTAVGAYALRAVTSGTQNVCVGKSAGAGITTGSGNVCVGNVAGIITTGSNNVIVGSGNAGGASLTGSNFVILGAGASPSIPSVSNEITLGNSSIATLRCQVTSITSLSDARDKTEIEALPTGLETVMSLRPVRFTWNMRDGGKVGIKDCGFIAQELQGVDDEYLRLVYAENPEKLEASYGRLIPVLVKAIQDLKQEIDEMKVCSNCKKQF